MKTLLVPTDFSENARNALDYAVALANQFGSQIILYHAFKVRITSRTFVSIDAILKEEAEEKIQATLREMRPRLSNNASIKGMAMRGDVIPAIVHRATSEQADLIVMGTEGASGIRGIVMGSTTVGVLESTDLPVMVIPKGAAFTGFQSIVLALDEKAVRRPGTLQPLIKIAEAYQLPVKVYHKSEPDHSSDLEKHLRSIFGDIRYAYYNESSSMDTVESIMQYARREMADLLCLVRRKRTFLEVLFQTSVTREQVLHGNIPMLIVKE